MNEAPKEPCACTKFFSFSTSCLSVMSQAMPDTLKPSAASLATAASTACDHDYFFLVIHKSPFLPVMPHAYSHYSSPGPDSN